MTAVLWIIGFIVFLAVMTVLVIFLEWLVSEILDLADREVLSNTRRRAARKPTNGPMTYGAQHPDMPHVDSTPTTTGWYNDPLGEAPFRWWTGTGWTTTVGNSTQYWEGNINSQGRSS